MPASLPPSIPLIVWLTLRDAIVEAKVVPSQCVIITHNNQTQPPTGFSPAHWLINFGQATLSVAAGMAMANPKLTVCVVIDAMSADAPDIASIAALSRQNHHLAILIVHSYSASSPFAQPAALALSSGASWVARSFTGDPVHMRHLMPATLTHNGLAVLDLLHPDPQPDGQFGYAWFRDHLEILPSRHWPTPDRSTAWHKLTEPSATIPVGLLFQQNQPTFEDHLMKQFHTPIVDAPMNQRGVKELIQKIGGE